MFTLIFLSLLFGAWLILAFVPWLIFSVLTRGQAGLANLPLCLFTGVVAALAVPTLGMEDSRGLWLSMVLASLAPTVLMVLRRISLEPVRQPLPREGEIE